LIDILLSQFNAPPQDAFKEIPYFMKEACIDNFDFIREHPTIDVVMNN
jgi:hypothetical protein